MANIESRRLEGHFGHLEGPMLKNGENNCFMS